MKKFLNVVAALALVSVLVFTACRNATTNQAPTEEEKEESDTNEEGAALLEDSTAQDLTVETEQ